MPAGGLSPTAEFEILRGDLTKVLVEATNTHPNITYRFGTIIDKILSNNDASVKVLLSNGEELEYDVLVAADGQWSTIRKQCFPTEALTVVEKDAYIGYWTVPRLPSDDEWWYIYIANQSRNVSLRPDPHGTMRASLGLMPLNNVQKKAWEAACREDKQSQMQLLRSEFAGAGWQTQRFLDTMDDAPDFHFQAIKQIRLSRWSQGRVVCLGDAAYAPTPLTGAGTSLALIGAYVLGGELSKLVDGQHPKDAIEAYDAQFRPHVETNQSLPSFVPSIAFPNGTLKRWLLQTVIWAVAAVLPLIAMIPWVARKIREENGDQPEDFPLPTYSGLEGKSSIEKTTVDDR